MVKKIFIFCVSIILINCHKKNITFENYEDRWVINLSGISARISTSETISNQWNIPFGSRLKVFNKIKKENKNDKFSYDNSCNIGYHNKSLNGWVDCGSLSSFSELRNVLIKKISQDVSKYQDQINISKSIILHEVWIFSSGADRSMEFFMFDNNLLVFHGENGLGDFKFYKYRFSKDKSYIDIFYIDKRINFYNEIMPDTPEKYIDSNNKKIRIEIKNDRKDMYFNHKGWSYYKQ